MKTILIWCNITMLENDLTTVLWICSFWVLKSFMHISYCTLTVVEPTLNIIKQLIKSSQQEENYTSAIQISLSVNNPVVKNASERKIIIEIMFMIIMRLLISLKLQQTRVERTSKRTHTVRIWTVSDALLNFFRTIYGFQNFTAY